MKHLFIGDVNFKNNVYITGDLTVNGGSTEIITNKLYVENNTILANTLKVQNNDCGLFFEKNKLDLQYISNTGTIISAGANYAEISYTASIGQYIEVVPIAERQKITNVIGNFVYVTSWTIQPTAGQQYNIYNDTYSGILYKTINNKLYAVNSPIGEFTTNTLYNTLTMVVKNIEQTNGEYIIYVGKNGNDLNDGRTISQAKLTFASAVSAGSYIICLDSEIYAENITATNKKIYAPYATVQNITSTASIINIGYFTAYTGYGDLYFNTCESIQATGALNMYGKKINTVGTAIQATGCNITGEVSEIIANTAYDIDAGTINIKTEKITATTLSNTNFTGVVNSLNVDTSTSITVGGGTQRWCDVERIDSHINNINNPHNTTINQISPLTTKGDIMVYSTSTTRQPVGADGYFLKANSGTGTGLEWAQVTSTPARSAIFALADGIDVNGTTWRTVGRFTWLQSEYIGLSDAKILLYNTGAIDVQFIGIDATVYATYNIASTGYYIIPSTIPVANTVIYLQVKGTGFIESAVLRFSNTLESVIYTTTTISANYNIQSTDDYILCNHLAPITLTMPAIVNKIFYIQDITGAANINTITITGTINPTVINTAYGQKKILNNGVNWYSF